MNTSYLSYLILVLAFLLSIEIVEGQVVPLADGFDYPIGTRGYVGAIPVPIRERISNEQNTYPSSLSTRIGSLGGNCLDQDVGWYNAQDIGSYYSSRSGYHPGEDWNFNSGSSDVGKSVFAVAKGKIIYKNDLGASGLFIGIEHSLNGTSLYTIYGHLSTSNSMTVGDIVNRGEKIGEIGPISAPHLHFELRNTGFTSLYPNDNGVGYYSNLANMLTDGFFEDPSDFIDDHRPLPINYGESLRATLNFIFIPISIPNHNYSFATLSASDIKGIYLDETAYDGSIEIDYRSDNLAVLRIENNYTSLQIDQLLVYVRSGNVTHSYVGQINSIGAITDINKDDWGYPYVRALEFLGLHDSKRFKPDDLLTRQEASRYLILAAQKLGLIGYNELNISCERTIKDLNYTERDYPFFAILLEKLGIAVSQDYNTNGLMNFGKFCLWAETVLNLQSSPANHQYSSSNLDFISNTQEKNAAQRMLNRFFIRDDNSIENIIGGTKNTREDVITRVEMAKILINSYVMSSKQIHGKILKNNSLSSYVALGDKIEFTDKPSGSIPSAEINFLEAQISEGESIEIGYSTDADGEGGTYNFYWTADDGILEPLNNSSLRKVSFTPPNVSVLTTVNLYSWIATSKGKIKERHIKIQVRPSDADYDCNAPNSIQINTVTNNTCSIEWSNNEIGLEGTGFIVELSGDNGVSWEKLVSNYNLNTFIISDLKPCTNYTYRVRTNCSNGNSTEAKAIESFSTTGCGNCPLPTVELSSPESMSEFSLDNNGKFIWTTDDGNGNCNVANWQFQISLSPSFSATNTLDLTESKYDLLMNTTGTIYWRVRAINLAGNIGPWSSSRVFSISENQCGLPRNLREENLVYDDVDLTWEKGGLSSSFEVEYGLTNSNSTSFRNTSNTSRSINLDPDQEYKWRVRSSNTLCLSDWTNWRFFRSPKLLCSFPSDMSVSNITTNSARLEWTEDGLNSYRIRYKSIDLNSWIQTPLRGGPWTNIDELASNTIYEWQIQTNCDAGVKSDWSKSNYFTTLHDECSKPNIVTTGLGDTYVEYGWNEVVDAENYQIEWKRTADNVFVLFDEANSRSTIVNLEPNTSYDIKLRSICENRISDWTLSSFVTGESTCDIPQDITVDKLDHSSAMIVWLRTGENNSYLLQWKEEASSAWISSPILGSNHNFYNLENLESLKKYNYRVRSNCDGGLQSTFTSTATFETLQKCDKVKYLNNALTDSKNFSASERIISSSYALPGSITELTANIGVEFQSGFEIQEGASLTANMEECQN